MTSLAACPSCARHVRINESRCPFCSVGLEGAFANRPSPLAAVGRLSRAALFALGATAAAAGTVVGCSDDPKEPEPEQQDAGTNAIYGAPAVDGGSDSGGPAPAYGAPAVDSGANGALYGLPPGSE